MLWFHIYFKQCENTSVANVLFEYVRGYKGGWGTNPQLCFPVHMCTHAKP
jgi:hypothetical protein